MDDNLTPEELADLVFALLGPTPPGTWWGRRRTKRAAARKTALRAARASGCTCDPDITYHAHDPHDLMDGPSLTVRHDDWCPMLGHPSQFIAYHHPGPHPHRGTGRPARNSPCPCGSGQKYKRCHGA